MTEELQLALVTLSAAEQTVLTLALVGDEEAEIALAIDKSPRTIRRIWAAAQHKFDRRLLGSQPTGVRSAGSYRKPTSWLD